MSSILQLNPGQEGSDHGLEFELDYLRARPACSLALVFLLLVLLLSGCVPNPTLLLPSPTPVRPTSPPPAPSLQPTPSPLPPTPTRPPVPTATPASLMPLGLQRLWRWDAQDILCAFLARDLDHDGQVDIAVAAFDRQVYRVDVSGREIWSFDTGGSAFSLDAADLNEDGADELIVGSEDGTLRVLDAAGALLWQTPLGGRVTAVAALDLEGNGRLEVLAGTRPPSWRADNPPTAGVYALHADGTLLWRNDTPGAPTAFLLLDTVENRGVVLSTEEGALLALDPAGVPLWQYQGDGYIRGLASADGGPLAGNRDGNVRWFTVDGELAMAAAAGGPVPVVAPADLDGDGRPEAVLAGVGGEESGLVALDLSGGVLWRTHTDQGVWSLAFPDLEGDGQREIAAGTDGGEILLLDSWGRVRGHTFVPWRVHGLLAADVNEDGHDELLARSSYHLYAFAGSSTGEEGEQQRFVETLAQWPADTALLPAAEDQVVLAAVGDVMLGRAVEPRMLVYGADFPLAPLAPLLRAADITTGNLEGGLGYGGQPLQKSFAFRAHPALVAGLAGAGFDLMTLANNHAGDFGAEGLAETIAVLRQSGIDSVGAGPQAYAPVFREVKGLKIAFLARNASIAPQEEVAWADENELRQAVAQARTQADVVVVHLHAGVEYSLSTDETQRRLARAAAEGGAALVIGHHSHSPQEVEWIGETLVAYSLGDFVFDIDDHDVARDAVVLRVLLSKRGVDGAEWIPARIVDDVQPRPLPGTNGQPLVKPLDVRPVVALPAPPSPRPAYALRAVVDPAACTVWASEQVTFPNTTGETLNEVVLQVFPNYQAGIFRLEQVVASGPDGSFRPEPSLEGTMLRLPLVRPLAPGDELEVAISFTLALPPAPAFFPQANLVCSSEGMVLAFWYPMLVPYRAGEGWETWANHPVGDPVVMAVADHIVEVTVPAGYDVVGGGQVEGWEGGVRLRLEAGRDLALVIAPGYEPVQREVDGVTIAFYARPAHRAGAEAALEAVAAALALFQERYGPYPYQTFRLVEAPISCGLEHSGMVILGDSFYEAYSGDPLQAAVRVAVHEFAHQWWYGVVGTDQVYEPWLDEGLAQYSEGLFYEAYYPELLARWWEGHGRPPEDPPSLRSTIFDFPDSWALLRGLYAQGATFLHELRELLGDEAFFALLRAFYRQEAFLLAGEDDLLGLARALGGEGVEALVEKFFP